MNPSKPPQDRLGEAIKQLYIVQQQGELTQVERQWLEEAGMQLLALRKILQENDD